jgi:hypothetical protein
MLVVRDPILQPTPIVDLRPTQMTVGMREVKEKRDHLRKHVAKKIGKYLGAHMIPVVLGPKQRPYIIDHHHLALALHKEGLEHVLVSVVANLSALEPDAFWIVLDHHAWVHPYDANGRRRPVADIPKSIADMADDPFRSLAGELRRAGGFAKDITPFSEFPVGGLPAPAHQAPPGREELHRRARSRARPREEPGGPLPARLVRPDRAVILHRGHSGARAQPLEHVRVLAQARKRRRRGRKLDADEGAALVDA